MLIYSIEANESLPVDVVSDSMQWDDENRIAFAIGNAEAIQGEKKLSADKLIVHLDKKKSNNEVILIEAIGNVIFETKEEMKEEQSAPYKKATIYQKMAFQRWGSPTSCQQQANNFYSNWPRGRAREGGRGHEYESEYDNACVRPFLSAMRPKASADIRIDLVLRIRIPLLTYLLLSPLHVCVLCPFSKIHAVKGVVVGVVAAVS